MFGLIAVCLSWCLGYGLKRSKSSGEYFEPRAKLWIQVNARSYNPITHWFPWNSTANVAVQYISIETFSPISSRFHHVSYLPVETSWHEGDVIVCVRVCYVSTAGTDPDIYNKECESWKADNTQRWSQIGAGLESAQKTAEITVLVNFALRLWNSSSRPKRGLYRSLR